MPVVDGDARSGQGLGLNRVLFVAIGCVANLQISKGDTTWS